MAEYGDPRGLGQRLMESAAVVAVYESRLWRRNPLVEMLMGISFARDELERQLAEAGFGAVEALHDHGLWLIAVATKR